MSKLKSAIEASSPHFRDSDILKELRKRKIQNPEALLDSNRDMVNRAIRDFKNSRVPIRTLTR